MKKNRLLKFVTLFFALSCVACHAAGSMVEKMTALDAAIEVDISPQRVKALLEDGSDPNRQSPSGYTPLIRASGELRVPREREHLSVEETRRADEIVALLLDHGANPGLRTKDGATALVVAVAANRPGAVAALLNKSASTEVETVSGDTPLLLAIHHCRIDIAKMLLEHGANAAHKNSSGKAAVDVATERCPEAISQLQQ